MQLGCQSYCTVFVYGLVYGRADFYYKAFCRRTDGGPIGSFCILVYLLIGNIKLLDTYARLLSDNVCCSCYIYVVEEPPTSISAST